MGKRVQTQHRPSVDHGVDPNRYQAATACSLLVLQHVYSWSTPGPHLCPPIGLRLTWRSSSRNALEPIKLFFVNPIRKMHLKVYLQRRNRIRKLNSKFSNSWTELNFHMHLSIKVVPVTKTMWQHQGSTSEWMYVEQLSQTLLCKQSWRELLKSFKHVDFKFHFL